MPYAAPHNIGRRSGARVQDERIRHFARRDAHERRRRDYLERLARQHADHTGLSLPVACRIVAALSIVAKKPAPEAPDYAHFEDALMRERTPALNIVGKFTPEEDAQIRALAAEGLHAAAIARRLQRKGSGSVARRARFLGTPSPPGSFYAPGKVFTRGSAADSSLFTRPCLRLRVGKFCRTLFYLSRVK
jgi:hypothetical protein